MSKPNLVDPFPICKRTTPLASKQRKMVTSLFLSSALCFLSLLCFARVEGLEHFFVEGKVYCDNCRAQFVNRISQYMEGAKVRLECRDQEGGKLTYTVDGVTDASGSYRIKVEGDHEEEVCEVSLIESSDSECAEIDKENFLKKTARVGLTKDNGITSDKRMANPLAFMVKDPLPECTQVLRELGITSEGLVEQS